MPIVIKTLRGGRQYYYSQQSRRVPGRKHPISVMKYLGPVSPKRKRGLTVGDIVTNILMGGVTFGAHAAKGTLGPPGGRAYKERPSFRVVHDPRHTLSEDEWSARRSMMTDQEWELYVMHAKHSIAQHPDKTRPEAMKLARDDHAKALDVLDMEAKAANVNEPASADPDAAEPPSGED
jgi:hypothetical protein